MFERFTDKARRVVVVAQEEARRLNHNSIGSEHILLGLLRVPDSIGCRALESLGASIDGLHDRLIEVVGPGPAPTAGHIPFTPDARKVLESALREALQIGHNYIGTEHVLLGLVRPEQETVASQVLLEVGIEHSRVRETVIRLLSGGSAGAESAPPAPPLVLQGGPTTSTRETTCAFCGGDLWDVTYYVAASRATICQDCVEAAGAVIEKARLRTAVSGALYLPPRVSGDPPDEASASRIVDAFLRVFGATYEEVAMPDRPVEDAESLIPAMEEAGRRHPNTAPVRVVVSRIRFRSADAADVRFTLFGFPFEGQAIRDRGTWKVSRDTFCRVLARGGVQCPPREPS